jgi:hypothetical protein
MKLFKSSILVVVLSFFAISAHAAEWTPFQLSLFNPVQIFPEETIVQGARINLLYGVNKELDGIDYGIINKITGTTKGAQVGAFPLGGINITGNLYGAQVGGIFGGVNIASGEVNGLQLSGIFGGVNSAGNIEGAQIGGFLGGLNMADNVTGLQLSGIYIGINIAKDVNGAQIGTIFNKAESIEGLQLGLVNVCNKMKGVQIGLVNVIMEGEVPFFPFVNASF